MARLYHLGAHPYLLGHLPRYGLLGLMRASYGHQMRVLLDTPAEQARAARAGSTPAHGEQ